MNYTRSNGYKLTLEGGYYKSVITSTALCLFGQNASRRVAMTSDTKRSIAEQCPGPSSAIHLLLLPVRSSARDDYDDGHGLVVDQTTL